MRAGTGWVAAAVLAAAACSGTPTAVQPATAVDEHQGPDVVCGRCTVTGGGQVAAGTQELQLSVDAVPTTASAPGFGGAGLAASGSLQLAAVPANELPGLRGDVDTILSCARTAGVLTASIAGTGGGGRFTANVTDGGPADDLVEVLGSITVGRGPVASGTVQVTGLDACHGGCGEGQCWCYDHAACEPCAVADPTPPAAPAPAPPPPPSPLQP